MCASKRYRKGCEAVGNTISIKEIARLAGTSVATVSRVINKNGRYSPETEARVRQIIEEYNYQPNQLAKGLREKQMNLIGVIVSDVSGDFFSAIVREVEQELFRLGYIMILCNTSEKEEIEKRIIESLSTLRISGIIYVGGKRSRYIFRNLPVVYVDRRPPERPADQLTCFIGSNNIKGGYMAAERLLAAGRRKPAIVLFEKNLDTQEQRYLGFRRAMTDYGFPADSAKEYHVKKVDYENGLTVTEEIVNSGLGHDAIFYASDILAIGGIHYLNEHGIRVPEQISVIGMDDIPASGRITPALTTIRQQYTEFGRLAADAVVQMLEGEPVEDSVLDVTLVERKTV